VRRSRAARSLALAAAALLAAGCGHDPTAASSLYIPGAFTIVLTPPVVATPPIDRVRVILTRASGEVAADTTIFGSLSAGVTHSIKAGVHRSFASTGEPMSLVLTFGNSAGSTIVTQPAVGVVVKAIKAP
jgi:hypothetical protein